MQQQSRALRDKAEAAQAARVAASCENSRKPGICSYSPPPGGAASARELGPSGEPCAPHVRGTVDAPNRDLPCAREADVDKRDTDAPNKIIDQRRAQSSRLDSCPPRCRPPKSTPSPLGERGGVAIAAGTNDAQPRSARHHVLVGRSEAALPPPPQHLPTPSRLAGGGGVVAARPNHSVPTTYSSSGSPAAAPKRASSWWRPSSTVRGRRRGATGTILDGAAARGVVLARAAHRRVHRRVALAPHARHDEPPWHLEPPLQLLRASLLALARRDQLGVQLAHATNGRRPEQVEAPRLGALVVGRERRRLDRADQRLLPVGGQLGLKVVDRAPREQQLTRRRARGAEAAAARVGRRRRRPTSTPRSSATAAARPRPPRRRAV